MSTTPNTAKLKGHVESLLRLLEDPHPGLMSWSIYYLKEMRFISDWLGGNDRTLKYWEDKRLAALEQARAFAVEEDYLQANEQKVIAGVIAQCIDDLKRSL